ncbi:DUF4160 domain-containing protein [Corticibacterium sp. UT-5YL-CI-8]|nr:DUF4160 domain-containing protein [Tianweitania sp. UT-5YL-CI-8]
MAGDAPHTHPSLGKPKKLGYYVLMVTLLRSAGMRFVIYTDDHEPAHVHVYGDGEARIDMVKLTVISNRGMKKRDLSTALTIVQANRLMFVEKWNEIHG